MCEIVHLTGLERARSPQKHLSTVLMLGSMITDEILFSFQFEVIRSIQIKETRVIGNVKGRSGERL